MKQISKDGSEFKELARVPTTENLASEEALENFQDKVGEWTTHGNRVEPIGPPFDFSDPANHFCPCCKSENINRVSDNNGIVGPGSRNWISYFFCNNCGVHFGSAPANRKTT